jgi:hypothetical protein
MELADFEPQDFLAPVLLLGVGVFVLVALARGGGWMVLGVAAVAGLDYFLLKALCGGLENGGDAFYHRCDSGWPEVVLLAIPAVAVGLWLRRSSGSPRPLQIAALVAIGFLLIPWFVLAPG